MNLESGGRLSMDELKDRNRMPTVSPQIIVECTEQVELLERLLAEQRRTNELLSALPTKEDTARLQASLNRMLEPEQSKQAGSRSARRSSDRWRRVRNWLWDHLPRPSLEWLIVIPLGGTAWLLWRLANHFAELVEQVLS